jgi:hypothetical protein
MKTQKQMWKEINEPKVEGLIALFNENGEPWLIAEIVDRIPRIKRKRKRRKQK